MKLDFITDQIFFKRINKKSASVLQHVWNESHDQNLEPEFSGQIIGAKKTIWILSIIFMESPY